MYNPTRGGTRGGAGPSFASALPFPVGSSAQATELTLFRGPLAAEFKWKDVQSDKDREHYLGHSVLAPAGTFVSLVVLSLSSRFELPSIGHGLRSRRQY